MDINNQETRIPLTMTTSNSIATVNTDTSPNRNRQRKIKSLNQLNDVYQKQQGQNLSNVIYHSNLPQPPPPAAMKSMRMNTASNPPTIGDRSTSSISYNCQDNTSTSEYQIGDLVMKSRESVVNYYSNGSISLLENIYNVSDMNYNTYDGYHDRHVLMVRKHDSPFYTVDLFEKESGYTSRKLKVSRSWASKLISSLLCF